MIMLNGRIRLEGFRNLAFASSKKDPVKSQILSGVGLRGRIGITSGGREEPERST